MPFSVHAQVLAARPRTTFNVSPLNGLALHCTTSAYTSLNYQSLISVSVERGRATLHRLIIDRTHGVFFGYDLDVYRRGDSPQIHLHFAPLSALGSFSGVDLHNFSPTPLTAQLADTTVGINVAVDLPLDIGQDRLPELTDHLQFAPAPEPATGGLNR